MTTTSVLTFRPSRVDPAALVAEQGDLIALVEPGDRRGYYRWAVVPAPEHDLDMDRVRTGHDETQERCLGAAALAMRDVLGDGGDAAYSVQT